jgi:ribosomal-protein-alanine N-acetyltransferase
VAPWTIERVVSERDLDAIVELGRSSFVNPWTRDMFTWELQHSDVSYIYVLRTADEVAAFCSCWLVFDELHINNIAVKPEARGHGLGTALLAHVLVEAARVGARRATLEVRPSNEAALKLYEHLGFRVAGTRRAYYRNPIEDALILWREGLSESTTRI